MAAQPSLPPDERVDDRDAIPDDTPLWRLIDPEAIRDNPATGERAISDGQFRTHEMSVRLEAGAFNLDALKRANPCAEVAEFTAGQARHAECIVTLDRRVMNGSHALVYRKDEPGKRLSGKQAAQLARAARLV